MSTERLQSVLNEIQRSALEAVDPEKAVLRFLNRKDDTLEVGDRRYSLKNRRVFLIGTGKAGVPMARAIETVLGDKLQAGLVVVKYGHTGKVRKTAILEAGHPEPDEQGLESSHQLVEFIHQNLNSNDLLLVVVSGGGSALLPAPIPEISFDEKRQTTTALLKSGATIHEMNAIRKHLSRLKGGRLLDQTKGADVIALLLSDVVGDDLTSIASGLTAPDPSTFEDCLQILDKYEIENQLPASVMGYLQAGARGDESVKETPKPGDPRFENVQNVIVGSNILALQAAAEKTRALQFTPLILSSSITGNTGDAAQIHVAIAREILNSGHPVQPPCCVISGGETTVRLTGSGKGGRNQEFALWCAREIAGWTHQDVLFASLGSDGNDGPTDAAGAIATPQTSTRAHSKGLSIDEYLRRNDSYHFFKELGDLIITGPTQTNVMDFHFILIDA